MERVLKSKSSQRNIKFQNAESKHADEYNLSIHKDLKPNQDNKD